MTADQQRALIPLVEDLQTRGIVATYSLTSWPEGDSYCHAFRLRSHGITNPITIATLFDEDALINRLADQEARQNHGAAIASIYEQSKEALIRDLANVYRARLQGKDLPVPAEVTVMELKVRLS